MCKVYHPASAITKIGPGGKRAPEPAAKGRALERSQTAEHMGLARIIGTAGWLPATLST